MTSKNGLPTIRTYTGLTFDYSDPTAEMICIEDIAHALSQVCRFAGQSREYYSVAQHSLLVSVLAGEKLGLAGLLHDASEAYCGDVVRPLKKLLPAYSVIEERAMRAIAKKFGLSLPLDERVKRADNEALAIEGRLFMVGREDEYGECSEPAWRMFNCIKSMPPPAAETAFLETFHQLAMPVKGKA